MISRKKILKIITVSSSATLMVGFVAFKAGAIDDYVNLGQNELVNSPPDSLKKDSTAVEPIRFSSSKSMILQEEETLQKNQKDSVETINLDDIIIPSSKSGEVFDADIFMGSSKSLRVFEPRDTLLLTPEIDTAKSDTLKATKSSQQVKTKYDSKSNSNGNANQNQKKP